MEDGGFSEGALGPHMVAPLPAARSSAFVDALASTECPALTARRARREELTGTSHDPIVWTRALGSNVWDVDGNRYVDLSAGFGAAALGHNHPELVSALQAQSGKLVHALGDVHPSDVKVALLQRLAALAPVPDARVMLGLSGSDAITAALKTALLATKKPGVLAFSGGYHGLDYAPLAACGYSEAFRAPFAAQLNPHVVFAPYPTDDEALELTLSEVNRLLTDARAPIGAVLVEPLQGRGGVIVPPPRFLAELSALCVRSGALLVLDAIMAGLGRTGSWPTGAERDLSIDLICFGKALGGGVPISACVGRGEIMQAWAEATGSGGVALHTGTFFGNPLACAAALATLQVLERDQLAQRAARVGATLMHTLRERLGHKARAVRGEGLLIGVDLGSPEAGLAAGRALLEAGYITIPAGDGSVLSLTPPLTIAEPLLTAFGHVLAQIVGASG